MYAGTQQAVRGRAVAAVVGVGVMYSLAPLQNALCR